MGVVTKAGVYIPTESECEEALGKKTYPDSDWMTYEGEGCVLCNGCGGIYTISEFEEHLYTCDLMHAWMQKNIRITEDSQEETDDN